VKLGQVLSSRVDLLPDEYLRELSTLTDRVEPFPHKEACSILEQDWASREAPIGAGDLPSEPMAAASLGQVYRVETPSGVALAVKVQRPGVRDQVCLDLFVLRSAAPWLRQYLRLNTDLVALVDEYGSRFVSELDYIREAESAEQFQATLVEVGLDSVCVAEPVRALTTERVLVTHWVEGVRIDADRSPEGARLCGAALTAYLTMLLETGSLHADPHPGNLLRTPDGRLCILDWGLVTTVSPEQQEAIISYFTHILAEDYAAVPQDLVRLGFIAEGRQQAVEDAVAAGAISAVFQSLASGGSARRRVGDVLPEIQEVRRRYGNIGQLPAYFTFILRAFSVLEGIGLGQDPDYAIVSDCYPYLISRLLREDGPRARRVLEALLYGPMPGPDLPRPPLNSAKVLRLFKAAASYAAQAATPGAGAAEQPGPQPEPELHAAAGGSGGPGLRQFLPVLRQLMRSSALQEVLVLETARGADALLREALEAAELAAPADWRGLAPPRTSEDEAVLTSWLDILEAVLVGQVGPGGATALPLPALLQEIAVQLVEAGPAAIQAALRELLDVRAQVAAMVLRLLVALMDRAEARAKPHGAGQAPG